MQHEDTSKQSGEPAGVRRGGIAPYAQWPAWLPLADLSPVEVKVYLALSLRADNGDRDCRPSHANLAQDAGVSRATVQRSIARLVELGAVVVESRTRSDGSQSANLYVLPREAPLPLGRGTPPASGERHQELDSDQNYTPPSTDVEDPPLVLLEQEVLLDDAAQRIRQAFGERIRSTHGSVPSQLRGVTGDRWTAACRRGILDGRTTEEGWLAIIAGYPKLRAFVAAKILQPARANELYLEALAAVRSSPAKSDHQSRLDETLALAAKFRAEEQAADDQEVVDETE